MLRRPPSEAVQSSKGRVDVDVTADLRVTRVHVSRLSHPNATLRQLAADWQVMLAIALMVGGLFYAGVKVRPAATPGLNGNYTASFAGEFAGSGSVVVGANSVLVKGDLASEDGVKLKLQAPSIPRDGRRFAGVAQAGGRNVEITGRIDPAAGPVAEPRVAGTFAVELDGRTVYGRFAAHR